MTHMTDRIRAALIGTIAIAAAAMLGGCARNDVASEASTSQRDAVMVAQVDTQATPEEMPEVVIRAAR
jgi:hypothetical protein